MSLVLVFRVSSRCNAPSKYLDPESQAAVTTVPPMPTSLANWSAATTFRPVEVPAKIPSSRASRRATVALHPQNCCVPWLQSSSYPTCLTWQASLRLSAIPGSQPEGAWPPSWHRSKYVAGVGISQSKAFSGAHQQIDSMVDRTARCPNWTPHLARVTIYQERQCLSISTETGMVGVPFPWKSCRKVSLVRLFAGLNRSRLGIA